MILDKIRNLFSRKVKVRVHVVDKMPSDKFLMTTDDLYFEKEFFISMSCVANERGQTFSQFMENALRWGMKNPKIIEEHIRKSNGKRTRNKV